MGNIIKYLLFVYKLFSMSGTSLSLRRSWVNRSPTEQSKLLITLIRCERHRNSRSCSLAQRLFIIGWCHFEHSFWAPTKRVFNLALWLVPDLTQIVFTKQHQESSDELVRLVLPFLYEFLFHLFDLSLAFVLHLIDFALQTYLLLFQKRYIQLFATVASLKIPTNVQIIIADDATNNVRCGDACNVLK